MVKIERQNFKSTSFYVMASGGALQTTSTILIGFCLGSGKVARALSVQGCQTILLIGELLFCCSSTYHTKSFLSDY